MQDADPAELNAWAPKLLQQMQALPMLRDVATDQQIAGTTATLTIDRNAAQRFGIEPQQIDDTLYDAFGQREVTQYFTQLNSYFVILEVPPQLEGDVATLRKLYVHAPNGQAVPLVGSGAHRYQTDHATGGEPSEPVPGGDHLVQSGARRFAGRCGDRDQSDPRRPARAAVAAGQLPGQRPGVPEFAQHASPT